MKKRAAALCLAGALALGTCTVSAANGTRNISATFRNIKIVVDGKTLSTSAEPFIYNGTTYLPIRAVGEAVGKEVTWDGNTNTVYLGAVPAGAIQTPATPAPAATGSLSILAEQGFSERDIVQEPAMVAEVYLSIIDRFMREGDIQTAGAAYAEAQAALARLASHPQYAEMKKILDEQYSRMLPDAQKVQERKQAQQAEAATADAIAQKYPAIIKSGWKANTLAKYVARIEAGEVSAWDIFDEFNLSIFSVISYQGDFQLAEDIYNEAQALIDLSVDKANGGNFDHAMWKEALEREYQSVVEQFQ